jgi:hypothetical protein
MRVGIGWRTAAVLVAMVVLLPLLVFVDMSSSAAHEQTTRRCDYDPISGQKFNCRNVPVPHRHRPTARPPGWSVTTTTAKPEPTPTTAAPTTAPPTTAAPTTTRPIVVQPKSCPPGQHSNGGAGRNCHSHSFTPPCGTGLWSPGHGHSYRQRPPCRTTTTTTTTTPLQCVPPAHRYGNVCHTHVFTPPCGTGLWAPHSGHAPQQRPPCSTTTITTTTTPKDAEPTACESTQKAGQRERERHRHPITRNRSGADSGCHYVEASHCPAGQHEHVHGSGSCHSNVGGTLYSSVRSNRHSGSTHHCSESGAHEHPHGSGNCHDADTIHCPAGQHAHPETLNGAVLHERCHSTTPKDHHCGGDSGGDSGYHQHDGLGCHRADIDSCPSGQHEHLGDIFPNVRGCHSQSAQHNSGELEAGDRWVMWGTGEILCTIAGGGAAKAVKLAQKGADTIRRWVTRFAVDSGTSRSCGTLWDKYVLDQMDQDEADKKREHNERAEQDSDDDSSGSAGASTPEQTTTTAPQTPQEAWNDAMNRYVRGDLDRAGLQAAADAYQCALGVRSKCK